MWKTLYIRYQMQTWWFLNHRFLSIKWNETAQLLLTSACIFSEIICLDKGRDKDFRWVHESLICIFIYSALGYCRQLFFALLKKDHPNRCQLYSFSTLVPLLPHFYAQWQGICGNWAARQLEIMLILHTEPHSSKIFYQQIHFLIIFLLLSLA